MSAPAIRTIGLTRRFGEVSALDGVDMEVAAGSVLALLGHNGAGKTTLVDILATLLPPSGGRAEVAGLDVVRHAARVRRRIGLIRQDTAVDQALSGPANLEFVARLLGAGRRRARERAAELIRLFGLREAAERPVRTYSGGMRRRLDLAVGVVGRPAVLFLDEPTTGLDPAGRMSLWETIGRLAAEGTTVLLTTQYLEEADRLADHIVVLASGRVVASGTAARLKAAVGDRCAHVTLAGPEDVAAAAAALRAGGYAPVPDPARRTVTVPMAAAADVPAVVRLLDGTDITELNLTGPTLDDVYLALTQREESRV
ncbi:daunorubicin/doxorubicin resistance ABC transporter ATP-binding protein DrrA [Spongiactinospora gelatinilytica]|uniref:Daunorubicin/doxorubicin resistance ABC transporter ATP-binding protein DrrA n=1 Tax=Spongiactinospora gelatinilytica TaxID=2666298 RepID=A0A2W2GVJ3_9ACTN|nr:ABC transporter ATP-binding protein [Spongiactinospora gelatinilytica]PZG38227.1 daunorubicin/doxorubicin resistance ABC transporter ATP-binding protein DrrA [Spongiactinospora gelatinilytica]